MLAANQTSNFRNDFLIAVSFHHLLRVCFFWRAEEPPREIADVLRPWPDDNVHFSDYCSI
jgi:hypothetical protein